jgi:hypothetical protein
VESLRARTRRPAYDRKGNLSVPMNALIIRGERLVRGLASGRIWQVAPQLSVLRPLGTEQGTTNERTLYGRVG